MLRTLHCHRRRRRRRRRRIVAYGSRLKIDEKREKGSVIDEREEKNAFHESRESTIDEYGTWKKMLAGENVRMRGNVYDACSVHKHRQACIVFASPRH